MGAEAIAPGERANASAACDQLADLVLALEDSGDPGERGRGRQRHSHAVPAMRQRMAERVQRALGKANEIVGDGKDDARRAEGDEARPRRRGADADCGSGVIAAPAGDGNLAPCEPPGGGDFRRKMSRNLRTLDQARHGLFGQAGRAEEARVPAPPPHIEPERPRSIRHLGHRLAREAQAYIVLRQQHALRRLGDLGLVGRHPQHFRRGEAGHGEIAGTLFEIGNAPLELGAFGERAAVVPQDRGPQRFVISVEQGCAVHLAGEANAG